MSYAKCQRLWAKTAFPSGENQALLFPGNTSASRCPDREDRSAGVCSCAALTTCKRGLISPHNKYGENLGGGPRNFKHVRGVHQHGHGGEGLPVLRACLPTLLMDSTAF